jgi:hypothetical protein
MQNFNLCFAHIYVEKEVTSDEAKYVLHPLNMKRLESGIFKYFYRT